MKGSSRPNEYKKEGRLSSWFGVGGSSTLSCYPLSFLGGGAGGKNIEFYSNCQRQSIFVVSLLSCSEICDSTCVNIVLVSLRVGKGKQPIILTSLASLSVIVRGTRTHRERIPDSGRD